jgi:dipeptide/tripeptide permease
MVRRIISHSVISATTQGEKIQPSPNIESWYKMAFSQKGDQSRMERMFGVATYLLGLIMMITMVLDAMGVIDQTRPIVTLAWIIFGYVLCILGYMFTRKTPPPV